MTDWTHRTIIVPAAYAPMARALAAAAGPAGSGGGMFQAMLSPDAGKPPTHYISAGLIWPEFAYILPTHDREMWVPPDAVNPAQGQSEPPTDSPGHPEEVVALAAKQGLPITLEQVQALFAACRVYTCGWQQAVAHMGLHPVVERLQ